MVSAAGRGRDVYQELEKNETERARKNQRVLRDLKAAKTIKQKKKALDAAVSLTAKWYPTDIRIPVDIARVTNGRVK